MHKTFKSNTPHLDTTAGSKPALFRIANRQSRLLEESCNRLGWRNHTCIRRECGAPLVPHKPRRVDSPKLLPCWCCCWGCLVCPRCLRIDSLVSLIPLIFYRVSPVSNWSAFLLMRVGVLLRIQILTHSNPSDLLRINNNWLTGLAFWVFLRKSWSSFYAWYPWSLGPSSLRDGLGWLWYMSIKGGVFSVLSLTYSPVLLKAHKPSQSGTW